MSEDRNDPTTPWAVGDHVLGGYVVERELGVNVGGMGRVWLLMDPSNGARFAAKRVQKLDPRQQFLFLRELLNWADLPDHPNLLPLRSFRTDGGELYLFGDYAEGGSLADWLHDGRLGGLREVVDAAIQFAWGLHVAHEHGLVHQDVKPSNAMMTADGRVMVGDFGLARSRGVAEGAEVGPCVSHGGKGTPAYCSPEQARGDELTRATDVWSWGLSLLEILKGEMTWRFGTMAAPVLEDHLARAAVPGWLAGVLRRCFVPAPAERWATMADVVEALREGWRAEFGEEYGGELTPVPEQPAAVEGYVRRTATGGVWRDPLVWLREALEMNGRDPAGAEEFVPYRGRWRRTYLIADMVALHEAARLLREAAEAGHERAEERLAALCAYDRSSVHEALDDRQGALPLYDRAIGVYERLVEREGRAELANDLAAACMNKANALQTLGQGQAALPLYDRAIAIRERLVEREGRAELLGELIWVRLARLAAARSLGESRDDGPAVRDLVARLRAEIERTGRADLQGVLAWAEAVFADLL